ncbi:MAG TPA: PaaI family thioesterase [Chloroflexi bacterium]|nr:PaaI family thioesterase [Chloroflexota bacterium]
MKPPFAAAHGKPAGPIVRPELREVLQPNSLHCFVCGLANPYSLKACFYQTGEQEVTAWYTIPEQYQSYPGMAHGGIVASLLDEVVGRSVMGTDPEHARLLFTARLTVKYRQHVPVGVPLRFVGRAVKDRGRVVTAWGGVFLADDDPENALPLAEAESMLLAVPEEELSRMDADALGWKVYPDCTPEE